MTSHVNDKGKSISLLAGPFVCTLVAKNNKPQQLQLGLFSSLQLQAESLLAPHILIHITPTHSSTILIDCRPSLLDAKN